MSFFLLLLLTFTLHASSYALKFAAITQFLTSHPFNVLLSFLVRQADSQCRSYALRQEFVQNTDN